MPSHRKNGERGSARGFMALRDHCLWLQELNKSKRKNLKSVSSCVSHLEKQRADLEETAITVESGRAWATGGGLSLLEVSDFYA